MGADRAWRWPALSLVLLAIGVAAAVRGTAYIGWSSPPPALTAIDTIAPFWVYSLIWFTAAGVALAAVVDRRAFNIAVAANASLWAVWGGSFIIASIAGWTGRSHLTGASFLLVAVLIAHTGRRANVTDDV